MDRNVFEEERLQLFDDGIDDNGDNKWEEESERMNVVGT